MRFAPNKYTLTHLTRCKRINLHALVRLQGVVVELEPVIRILGLQLDFKLHWKAYKKAIKDKIST